MSTIDTPWTRAGLEAACSDVTKGDLVYRTVMEVTKKCLAVMYSDRSYKKVICSNVQ